MTWAELVEFLTWLVGWLWGQWQVQVLVCHVAVNVVVAVAVTVATGDFVLAKTGEFLYKKILPLVLVFGAFSFAGDVLEMGWVALAAWGLLETLLLGDLLDNLKKLGIARQAVSFLGNIPAAWTKERLRS
jgi:hypothetical protein